MTFECSACHMRYRIDDSIVPRGGARVRCRQCSTLILIPAPPVVPAPVDLDLIPPPEPGRTQAAPPAPRAPSARSAPAAPANAPDWLTSDPGLEAPAPFAPAASPEPAPFAPPASPAPARPAFQEPPAAQPSESVGGMAVVGESPGIETFGVERFAPSTPPPSGARDPAFEDIGMSVARFETGPAMPVANEPGPAAPSYPRLETEPIAAMAAPPAPPAPPAATPRAPVASPAAAPEPVAPPPRAPAASPAFTAPAEAGAGASNVVPLTMGTPIPGGLPPDERMRHEKARRLARVLASDIAIYNREKKDRGMQEGNLVAVLGYEIKKSWETYKERVGAEFANSTPYFRDALNDMLAEGKKVF
jgi:predicted Zn finger-like uncharacterized protein